MRGNLVLFPVFSNYRAARRRERPCAVIRGRRSRRCVIQSGAHRALIGGNWCEVRSASLQVQPPERAQSHPIGRSWADGRPAAHTAGNLQISRGDRHTGGTQALTGGLQDTGGPQAVHRRPQEAHRRSTGGPQASTDVHRRPQPSTGVHRRPTGGPQAVHRRLTGGPQAVHRRLAGGPRAA